LGVFGNVIANTSITTQNLIVNGTFTSPTITSGSFTGQATLNGVSTAPTTDTNASKHTNCKQLAWVKNVLNYR
jgi:hypothetical protein